MALSCRYNKEVNINTQVIQPISRVGAAFICKGCRRLRSRELEEPVALRRALAFGCTQKRDTRP